MTRRAASPPPTPRPQSAWQENIESLIWAIALALIIRTFLIAPFKIPSGSMQPTLMIGDRILVNKLVYRYEPPERGEVLVFRSPEDVSRPFIKRLIAVGGDRVQIRHGDLIINGELWNPPGPVQSVDYKNQGAWGQEDQVITVPEGMFYVLGDNSGSSSDSRFWGFVPRKYLVGKAVCIFWPFGRMRLIR